ncbi:MAG: hypothetical protein OSB03_05170 [Vicinamibacterales bacterium]|nr:hypothetical protein [Vicinamibacterales bacterium]
MKILFSMRHPGALRNFASTVRELAERGHHVHLAFVMQDKLGDGRLLWDLTDDYANITHTELAKKKTPYRFWLGLARGVRFWSDYLRYLAPEYRDADKLRERAQLRLPRSVVGVSKLPLVNSAVGRRLLWTLLLWIEQAIPTDRWVDALIASQKPDVVLVTPLVDLGSDQADYVKSARALGIRTGLCVHSWDNLTNKGLIRIKPDRVFLWNESQKREAVDMHGVPAEHVVVTGSPVYDQWFARTPSTTREEFCAKIGLPADRPFLVYLCSSGFIAPNEAAFVDRWVRELASASDERVRTACILVRPHPQNLQPWHKYDFAEFDHVSVWPAGGANPVDADSKNDFYDSLFHSTLAVGVNTSAQIEAGIVGRPVFTIQTEEHVGTQDGTLHFQYLLNAGGGLLHNAHDFDEHVTQVTNALDELRQEKAKLHGFLEAFVRPRGLEAAATPLIVAGIEELGSLPRPAAAGTPLWLYPLRWVLYPLALGLKVVREFTRVSRKRQRQLRPLSLGGLFWKPVFAALDVCLRLRPAKSFVKKYVVPRVLPRMNSDEPTEEMVAIPRIIDKLHKSDRPLIVGPWLSEVGFEMLYWLPFLNWVKSYRHFDPERLIIVSRGGVASWYEGVGARYIDVFDFFTPEQLKQKNEQRIAEGQMKQRVLTDFDREVVKLVKLAVGRRDAEIFHPMYMYRLFYPYWKSRASVNLIESFSSFERLPAIDRSDVAAKLPDTYVAVRFYYNSAFPETEENRDFVRRLLTRVTETTDVVLLNPGFRVDDHSDLAPDVSRRVHAIDHLLEPRNNLEVQTKVISGASAYVGNYGGLSYVAPFYGVRSLAFYSSPEHVAPHHLDLMNRVAATLKRGSFVALDVQALDLLNLVVQAEPPASGSVAPAGSLSPAGAADAARGQA